ncbi:hypothetical protein BJ170DRAFT_596640 [Xylariales sp. AK1849]|nr:hypothetical protein BJ170DRAFT_596640 [Xylariales sp. AK1849]
MAGNQWLSTPSFSSGGVRGSATNQMQSWLEPERNLPRFNVDDRLEGSQTSGQLDLAHQILGHMDAQAAFLGRIGIAKILFDAGVSQAQRNGVRYYKQLFSSAAPGHMFLLEETHVNIEPLVESKTEAELLWMSSCLCRDIFVTGGLTMIGMPRDQLKLCEGSSSLLAATVSEFEAVRILGKICATMVDPLKTATRPKIESGELLRRWPRSIRGYRMGIPGKLDQGEINRVMRYLNVKSNKRSSN